MTAEVRSSGTIEVFQVPPSENRLGSVPSDDSPRAANASNTSEPASVLASASSDGSSQDRLATMIRPAVTAT